MSVNKLTCVVIVTIVTSAAGQVCTRKKVVPETEILTRSYSYTETYYAKGKDCGYRFWLWRRCKLSRTNHYDVPYTRNVYKIEEYCCSGYTRREAFLSSSLKCDPVCEPSCTNGYCQAPSKCSCNSGYKLDPLEAYKCLPVCHDEYPCDNGICTAPDTCTCNFGYRKEDGVCKPVCTDPCVNGICSAPETCSCIQGYKMSVRNTCEADCPSGCTHGHCIAPGLCKCSDGYELVEGQCILLCFPACRNGVCVATNVCQCNQSNRNVSSGDGDCESTTPSPVSIDFLTDTTPIEMYSNTEVTVDNTEGYTNVEKNDLVNSTASIVAGNMTKVEASSGLTDRLWTWWMLALSTIICILTLIAIAGVILKRKAVLIYFKGRSYVVEGDIDDVSAVDSQFETVKFSVLQKSHDRLEEDIVCDQ